MSHEAVLSLENTTLDDYQIGTLVRMEGYGPVFKATNQKTQASVHLHVLQSPDQRALSADRFRHGVYSAKSIHSSNLTPLDGSGKNDQFFYIAYTHHGLTALSDEIRGASVLGTSQESIPIERLTRWVKGLMNGLTALHGQRAFHHALSLNTLWVDASDQLLISHQGIAPIFKKRMQALTSAMSLDDPIMLARAPYVSPEEIRGRLVNQSADLYAVSVIIFELLMGAHPFSGPNAEATLKAHTDLEYQHLNTENLPPEVFTSFFSQAFAKEARSRFVSAQAMLSSFEGALKAFNTDGMSTADHLAPEGTESDFSFSEYGDDLGFSQTSADERTFLEFGDVDDQTFFESDFNEAIEVAHRTGVYGAIELDEEGATSHGSADVQRSSSQSPPPPMKTAAFVSVQGSLPGVARPTGPPVLTTLPLTSQLTSNMPLGEEILELQDDVIELAPSKVLPIPKVKSVTPLDIISTPQSLASASSTPPPVEGLYQSGASAPALPKNKSPVYSPSPVTRGKADEWPGENAPPEPPQWSHSQSNISTALPTNKGTQRRAPKLQSSQSVWQRLKGVFVALILAGIGASAVAIFNPFNMTPRPEMLMIMTDPGEMNMIIESKQIREKTPYHYNYSDIHKAAQELNVKFIKQINPQTRLFYRVSIPVFNGQSSLYLKAPRDPKKVNNTLKRVIISTNTGQAQVRKGANILGTTPLIYLGQSGAKVNFTVSIPGDEKEVLVTLGESGREEIRVDFDLPSTAP